MGRGGRKRRQRECLRLVPGSLGFSWQITSRRLLELTTTSDKEAAKRAFAAIVTMKKIDIAALDDAVGRWQPAR